MQVTRRKFFKICAGGMAGTSVALLGFAPVAALAAPRENKLIRAKETRQTCTYCAVGCGMLMYTLGDSSINDRTKLIHIEGDPDHPVSRGSLCPRGAGALDFVNSPNRVQYPEYRAPGSDKWVRISWDEAINRIARLMKDDRDANFQEKNAEGTTVNRWVTTGMLCASAASNETCWLTHKWGRALGMVVIDNQGSTCHAPTVAALAPSFGRGAMTNHWVDIKNANVVVTMGSNPAECHPVGFKWVVEAKKQSKAKYIAIDPRFNRSAAVADHYIPLRVGTDIAFLMGAIRWLLKNDKIQHEYVKNYTNATFLINDGFDFKDGYFTGYDDHTHHYDKSTWTYQLDASGNPIRDMTMQNPRCVINLLRKHVDRYTPEMVERITGVPAKDFQLFCETIGETSAPDKTTTFMYALGWTQHTVGVQNIRSIAMIQLLLGNIGMAGGGVNALRGHSNVQGTTDLGLYPHTLPAYLKLPIDQDTDLKTFLTRTTPVTLGIGQVNYWKNTPKFMVSLLKAFYGDNATADNQYGFDFLPKRDQAYDPDRFIDLMYHGKVNGYICQGMNALASLPNKNKTSKAFQNLKFLIVMDPIKTSTSDFWQNHGEMNDVTPADIKTEVFRLPTTCFAEEDGSIANSGRWLQWHYKAVQPPYEAKTDNEILSLIRAKMLDLYRKEGGKGLESFQAMQWNYENPLRPTAHELAKENNGYALEDLYDKNGKLIAKKGQLLSTFGHLRDDGTTMAGCWIYTGQWTEKGNQMENRDNADPSGLGNTLGWSFAWPLNRRILYNRASADLAGKPWNADRQLVRWNGTNWNYIDVADFGNAPPNTPTMPFIMQPDGAGALFALNRINDGPMPEHYEPMETPIGTNPLHPNVIHNPVVRVLPTDKDSFGTAKDFPYAATTYGITELFHCWTGQALLNVICQPQQFVEVGADLAKEKGIKEGDKVKVMSKRGFMKGVAVVTKRLRPLHVNGMLVHQIGIPTPWSFNTVGKKGFIANTLTPSVGDANTQTPEYKAFLVNIEKVEG
ncbi:formate dehydrogenase-N subunit alpha [Actinobacillus delphinicola]|uniref:formate dehydrogenase-N subunit alpha n=1 Tax=Actinobacillus delphinicola TaxID=51161 RepID=UPI0024424D0C|nr:formate dehydrogenase-N subunit alpha [Actinobacillus delphinicola]